MKRGLLDNKFEMHLFLPIRLIITFLVLGIILLALILFGLFVAGLGASLAGIGAAIYGFIKLLTSRSTTKICPSCGKKVSKKPKHCPHCG